MACYEHRGVCGRKCAIVDPRVTELHCIMPMANVQSVMARGILSYERAAKLQHDSVALPPVQEKRDKKQIPGGLKLHQYANLYFHARNPMMFKRQAEAPHLCVLRVSIEVLEVEGAVISDQNAASDYVRFLHPRHSHLLDLDAIYAMDWRHPGNPAAYYRHSLQKCAEVLVPHRVDPQFVTGAYVVDDAVRHRLEALGFGRPIAANPVLFFR
jgi:ssDNA thymidine ADP-ribosyltransferase, DarT